MTSARRLVLAIGVLLVVDLAGGLLAIACLVSAISGFFDVGLGNDELSGGLVVFQVFLLVVTATVGVLAALRAVAARSTTALPVG